MARRVVAKLGLSDSSAPYVHAALAGALLFLAGCAVGDGSGEVSGVVEDPICGISGSFDLEPSFFVSNVIEQSLEIRVQHGGDYEIFEDGIAIGVSDVGELHGRLGESITIDGARNALVTMNFYANESCPVNFDEVPIHYLAVSGSIEFSAVHAPMVHDGLETAARFDNVRFVDPNAPTERFAVLSGWFSFFHNRGRPAQPFP